MSFIFGLLFIYILYYALLIFLDKQGKDTSNQNSSSVIFTVPKPTRITNDVVPKSIEIRSPTSETSIAIRAKEKEKEEEARLKEVERIKLKKEEEAREKELAKHLAQANEEYSAFDVLLETQQYANEKSLAIFNT